MGNGPAKQIGEALPKAEAVVVPPERKAKESDGPMGGIPTWTAPGIDAYNTEKQPNFHRVALAQIQTI